MVVVSGDGQEGDPGEELPDPLVIQALDERGRWIRDQLVNFRVTEGGGSVWAGTAMTDEKGYAREYWTLGQSGDQTVEARAVDPTTGAKLVFATFSATLVAPPPPLRWEGLAALRRAVRAAAGAADRGKIYVFGDAVSTTDTQIYDPQSDAWTVGASLVGGRDWAMAATMADGIHLVGGTVGSTRLADHEVYDPNGDIWTTVAPLPLPVNAGVAAVVGSKLYIIGGAVANAQVTGEMQIYDQPTSTWSSGTPMPTPRVSAAVAVIGGLIYVAGGQIQGIQSVDVLEIYDPATDTWEAGTSMPAVSEALGGGVVDGEFCVFGGRLATPSPSGDAFPETYCYDPVTATWASGPDMITPRVEPASVNLDGSVYAIGGRTQASLTTTVVERLLR
jgi:hypothetical protein